jgi:hypothetical protein
LRDVGGEVAKLGEAAGLAGSNPVVKLVGPTLPNHPAKALGQGMSGGDVWVLENMLTQHQFLVVEFLLGPNQQPDQLA